MRKFFIFLFMIVSLVMVIGCNNGLSENLEIGKESGSEVIFDELGPEVQAAINKFGTSPKLFKQKNYGRFYTGQKVRWNEGSGSEIELLFEAYLVEFEELNSVISKYLETLTNDNNALTHQDYENVEFIKGKKYVEFSTYKVYEAGKDIRTLPVYQYETRTFLGDSKNNPNSANEWYAKSVSFDPTLTIDINRNYNIVKKEHVNYEHNVSLKKYEPRLVPEGDYSKITYFDHIKNFGEKINKIYRNYETDSNKPTEIYLIEFDDIYSDVKDYIKGSRFWEKKSAGEKYNTIITPNKTYLEFEEFTEQNYSTGEDWQSCILRLKEPNTDWYGDVYTWCMDVNYKNLIKILSMHNYSTEVIDGNSVITSIPEIGSGLNEIGTISKVYKNIYPEYPNDENYLVDYSVCPNKVEIDKYLKQVNNVVTSWTDFKGENGNVISVNNGENFIQVKKVVQNNGGKYWEIYKNIEGKIYQCNNWYNNPNEFFSLLGNGKVKDFTNVKAQLKSEVINETQVGNIYESKNPILLKNDSSYWYQSFLIESSSIKIGTYEKINVQEWTNGNYGNLNFDNNNKYVEVVLSGNGDTVREYSLKIRNNEVWDIVFENKPKEYWYDFLGIPYDPMKELFSNFGEINTLTNKGEEGYFVNYSSFRNEDVLNTYITENGTSEDSRVTLEDPKTLCFVQLKNQNGQVIDRWTVYKNYNNKICSVNIWKGQIEDFYNATGVVTKKNITEIGTTLKEKLKEIDTNVNVYSSNLAELIVETGKVSYLFEFNKDKINLKKEDDENNYTSYCYQGHLGDNNYKSNCRYIEIVIDVNQQKQITKYTVIVRNENPKLEDGNQCWSSWKYYTPTEFDNFITNHKG